MLDAVFLVPLMAALVFITFGNVNRGLVFLALPPLSLGFIYLIAGWPAIASALLLILPAFFLKEFAGPGGAARLQLLAVIGSLALFIILKNYFGVGASVLDVTRLASLNPLLQTAGLSFLIFRVIEFQLYDTSKWPRTTPIDKPGLPGTSLLGRLHRYLCFCLAFPSFASGPILRWRAFSEDYHSSAPIFANSDDLKDQTRRIANGLMKISFLSQPLLLVVLGIGSLAKAPAGYGFSHLLFLNMSALFYLAFLFINFSGFSDVMIASARFLGLRLPENFNRPFASANFLDFWNHWHLSVSLWFRDFIFTPVVKFFVTQGIRSNFICSAGAYVLTFALLGLWHGRTWPFLLCGFLLAFGALVNTMYREFFRKRVNKAIGSSGLAKEAINQLSRSLTYTFIALAIMGLWMDSASLAKFWSVAIMPAGIAAFLLTVAVLASGLRVHDALSRLMSTRLQGLLSLWLSNTSKSSLVKIVISLLFWQWVSVNDIGAFVYEGF